ncbi:putative membrane protein [Bacillus phage SP-15]|uniref:Putative membrane protein n=1 Tax=Bacillus phage SP-15 TaxID=1792032 RepID=A0A127AWX8_9CAUD|nr:hypothetical protein SP15_248 [Bacillus phage SP-15]AMM45053.1 putative membrane protein [Bacillus phage SP-15]
MKMIDQLIDSFTRAGLGRGSISDYLIATIPLAILTVLLLIAYLKIKK